MYNIFRFLEDKNISYAIIEGGNDYNGIKEEYVDFKQDIDIILDCKPSRIINKLISSNDFNYLENNSFFSILDNLRVDLYFQTINVGYYHFLRVRPLAYRHKRISEQEYIIYQLIDPLIKFSKYEERHKHRLRVYFEREENQESIREALSSIIGDTLAKYLIYKILDNDFALSLLFIKRCKFRMLFINGNFVRMIKSRIFRW